MRGGEPAKGVSAAGVSWSFDPEAAEVSDDSITLAQPAIDVFMARGFIPYSIEVGEDWHFQQEMARLLAAGYEELLLSKVTAGSGNGEGLGLITGLDATTTSEVVVTTDGSFGLEDVSKVWKALPQKYRRKASWMMSADVNVHVRNFGSTTSLNAQTVTLTAGAAETLYGRPTYENSYFPDFSGTTGATNILVVGDFQNYAIVARTGLSVELVPHLFGVTANRPTGQRGLFAYGRVGGGLTNAEGFRLLQNQ